MSTLMTMQVIDMGDNMHFEVLPGASKDELVCNMEGVPLDESNLVIKASLCCSVCFVLRSVKHANLEPTN